VGESFSILWADKQLMLFPVLSGISCMIVTLLLGAGGLAIFLPAIREAGITPQNFQHSGRSPEFMAAMFVFYLANYFVIVFFNVALVGVANSRLTGGSWTFDQGLQLAWKRKWVILQWAFVAATVGMVLRMLSERAGFVGRIVISIIGIAWNLACYFVVPVLAFEDLTPVAAIYRSSELFRETWGEKVVGGFSLGMVFFYFDAARVCAVVRRDTVGGTGRHGDWRCRDGFVLPAAFGDELRGTGNFQCGALPIRVRSGRPAGIFEGPDRVGVESERLRVFKNRRDDEAGL